jgi:hypothetical protein
LTERSVRGNPQEVEAIDLRLYRMWEYSHARSVLRCTSGSEICGWKKLFAAAQAALEIPGQVGRRTGG